MEHIKVMLVDDQAILREGLRTIINMDEHLEVVYEADNGEEAVEQFNLSEVDVILMDIRMPIMNGIEATKRIKDTSNDVSIVVLTTFNEEELIIDALLAGADGYLLKDIDGKHLVSAILDAANGNLLLPVKVANMLAKRISDMGKTSNYSIETGIEKLSQREKEIGELIGAGYSNKRIAETLYLSEGTVKNYISEIYAKVGDNSRLRVGMMFRKK